MPPEPSLDKRRIRRNFARAAAGYEGSAVLSREVCARMLERLDLVRLAPARILDAGSGTGLAARAVAQRYPRARVIALDFSLPMLSNQRGRGSWREAIGAALGLGAWVRGAIGRGAIDRGAIDRGAIDRAVIHLGRINLGWINRGAISSVCSDFERLPIRTGSMDLVVSNLALHWSDAPEAALVEMQRVLRRGGLLMFTTLGPDTLTELAQASADASGRSPVHRFMDMHDLGDLLVHSGFADPVMDMEYLTLTYAELNDLVRDLRGSGAMSARVGSAGLRTPRWRESLAQRYEYLRRDGRLPATFEIVYGHAWKPEQGPRVTADGHAVVRLDLPRNKR
jgi:malonyl-CoA O-methyltransferase